MRFSIISLLFPFTVNAALSATTAKTIQGTEPLLKPASQENRLGFTVGGVFYSQELGNIDTAIAKTFDKDLTFNDFVVKTLTATDFSVPVDYDDIDGDIAKATGAFTASTSMYKWTDNAGVVVQPSDYGKVIGCGSGYAMPLTLEIKSDVSVHSEYGDPRDSTPTTLTKTYKIESTTALCYAKPNQMRVAPTQTWLSAIGTWNSGSSLPDIDHGGGYSSDFDPTKGFKASASTKFPTTGFPGAQFQLVMTGAQTDWAYSVLATPSGSVEVVNAATTDRQIGDVILVSKPTGKVTVTAKLKSNTSIKYDYEFTLSANGWFVPKGTGSSSYATAITTCVDAVNLPTRAELTNSPLKSAAQGISGIFANYYTRAIGGGLTNEWGWLEGGTGKAYPDSSWISNFYWTQDAHTTGILQFVVHSGYGYVTYPTSSGNNHYVACRG